MKTCLIKQPAGIGDIFFLQKMVDYYIDQGFSVIFPILPSIFFINDYIKKENLTFYLTTDNFPYKEYYEHNDMIVNDDFVFIPTQMSDMKFAGSCMESKYKMIDLDFNGWQSHFHFIRNIDKENELYYNVLGLKDNEKYCLIGKTWGTQPNIAQKDVYYEFKNKVIELTILDGFTIFDWCKVIENAHEISIVDTSTNYLIEKLDLKCEQMYLTSRFKQPDFSHIRNLFNKNWIYL